MNTDFQCERRLRELSPEYHELVRNAAFVMTHLLDKYTTHFPEYTDHSSMHALQVLDFCNRLIGDQIDGLNADDLYVLIMSCYLHDSGMGISDSDYKALRERIVSPEYISAHPNVDIKEIIRNFHHEFSGGFIRKYAPFFEIPSQEHVDAIVMVSRGHRKTDLLDRGEYPDDFRVPNGNTVCVPYLSALIRLADEMDIASDRNIFFDYSEHEDNVEWRKHHAIRHMEITEDAFVLNVVRDDEKVMTVVEESVEKLQQTLDFCREVSERRTPFRISQRQVVIRYL